MNILTKAIEAFFNDLNLKLRMRLVNKTERRIKKLEHKLFVEKIYYKELLRESKEWCDSIKKGI